MRVPDPPHMITGLILGIHSLGLAVAIAIVSGASSAIMAAPKQWPDLSRPAVTLCALLAARGPGKQ
jgi:hypothetical protein